MAWNKGAEHILGYTADEVVGKNVDIIYSEEEIKTNVIKKRTDLVNKEGKFKENGWRVKGSGTKYYADITIFKMVDDDGELIHIPM